MKLKDKVAIVTGSTGGIGKGIAFCLAQEGAKVVVTSRSQENAEKTAKEITASGNTALPCKFNLEDHHDAHSVMENTIREYGKIDILVNNALNRVSLPFLPFDQLNYAQLKSSIETNVTSTMYLTICAFPYLQKTKGTVINIGSAVVNRNMLGIPLYTIIKGAITQVTKALAAEWSMTGIRVNQINPGFVPTDTLKDQLPPDHIQPLIEHFKKQHPLGRVGNVNDIGTLVSYLSSENASWMTGAIIDIDGGYSIQGLPPMPIG